MAKKSLMAISSKGNRRGGDDEAFQIECQHAQSFVHWCDQQWTCHPPLPAIWTGMIG